MGPTAAQSQTIEAPVRDVDEALRRFWDDADLWAVIVWNDDVNTFQNVIKALVEIMQHSFERAEQLAWKVHNTGKAVVGVRPREEAARAVKAIQARGIGATMDRAGLLVGHARRLRPAAPAPVRATTKVGTPSPGGPN
jgi:ATP-dependent Clp protease adapter protein ClpS